MCIGSSKKSLLLLVLFVHLLCAACLFNSLPLLHLSDCRHVEIRKSAQDQQTPIPLATHHTQSLSIFLDPQSQNRRHFLSLLLFFFQLDGWWWRETGVFDSAFNSRHSHIPSRHNRKKKGAAGIYILPTPFYLKVSAVDAFGSHKLFNWTDQPTRRDCYSLHLVYPVHIISMASVTGWLRSGDVRETTRKSSTRRIVLEQLGHR